MKLRAKILLLLLPFVVLPLIALGGGAYYNLRGSLEQETLREARALLQQVALQFRSHVSSAQANLAVLAGLHEVERYLLTADEQSRYEVLQPSLLALLAEYQRAFPDYYEIRLILPDGYEDTRSTNRDVENRSEEEAGYDPFKTIAQAREDQVAFIGRNPDNGEMVLYVSHRIALLEHSAPVHSARPSLRGYAVLTVSLDVLDRQVREASVGAGGALSFATEAGQLLHDIGPLPSGDYLGERVTDAMRAGRSAHEVVRHGHGDATHLMTTAAIFDGLYGVVTFPAAAFSELGKRIATLVTATTVITIAITTFLLYGALRRILLHPIGSLSMALREVASGNFDVSVEVRGRDEMSELALSFQDMANSLERSNEQVRYLAYHDGLTGLPNRRMFAEQLDRALSLSQRRDRMLALLFLDVDDFKRVNDSLGHQAGDDLLKQVASRIGSVVRDYDTVGRPGVAGECPDTIARVGGDEFVVLLADIDDEICAARVGQRLLDGLTAPFAVLGHDVHCGASIGITVYPRDGADAVSLIKNADVAMYHVKSTGKNAYHFYDASMDDKAMERLALEGALRKALEHDELSLHYQPQIVARTGQIVAAEALLRWQHPELGSVSPAVFIPIAEETGLIGPIGEWVLAEACRQNRAWQDRGRPPIRIAVNISNRQFGRADFERRLTEVVVSSGLDPKWLELELTETSIMEAPERVAELIEVVKLLGVKVSMDDFGTGYSSLAALRRLPLDTLKIDRSFVSELPHAADDAAIIGTIIAMGRALDLKIVAEGVETAAQLEFLRRAGCDLIQGYFTGRPMPADELEALLMAAPVALSA